MAEPRKLEPVIRFCAVISRHPTARQWAIERLREHWGDASEIADPVPFEAHGFYESSMGAHLQKVLVAFAQPADPAELAEWKTTTNGWESEYAQDSDHPETRPLNLDPGYITQAKLVLATTKDRDHRIYLHSGMFAEVTLNYMGGRWVHHRWTYPDYRTEHVAGFAMRARNHLREILRATDGFRTA